MHHGPNCGGVPADPPYYDALAAASANIIRAREIEAQVEKRRERQEALTNQMLAAAVARADRQEAVRQLAAQPRVLPSLETPSSSADPALEQPPRRVLPTRKPNLVSDVLRVPSETRQALPAARPSRRTPRSPR